MKKKLLALLLAAGLVLSLASCSNTSATTQAVSTETQIAGNLFVQYLAKGYTYHSGIGHETYEKDGKTLKLEVMDMLSPDRKDYVRVTARLTEAEGQAMDAIEFDADYFDKLLNFLKQVPEEECSSESLNDRIPSDDELAKYVGKTIEDLIADGFERYNDETDDQGDLVSLVYANWETGLELSIYPEAEYLKENKVYSMTDEEIEKLTITKVQFYGLEEP